MSRTTIPEGHIEVQRFGIGLNNEAGRLTRVKNQYFTNGKPVTLKQALAWYARMENRSDSGGGDWVESSKFLAACAKLMK